MKVYLKMHSFPSMYFDNGNNSLVNTEERVSRLVVLSIICMMKQLFKTII